MFNTFSVISSPIKPSPLVIALNNLLFLYISDKETPSILQSTLNI